MSVPPESVLPVLSCKKSERVSWGGSRSILWRWEGEGDVVEGPRCGYLTRK